jgi:anti-sigma factor RsiW
MMQCRDIDDLLMDYLYQELDAARTAELESHVHDCARCEAEIGRLQRTRQALRELPELEPSLAVSTRILHEANRRARSERLGFFGWVSQLIQPIVMHPAWTAGLTAVVLLAVTTLLSIHGRSLSPAVQSVAEERSARPATAGVSAAHGQSPDLSPPADPAQAQAPAQADNDAFAAKAPAARPPAVRTPESPVPSEGGKVASPAIVSGPTPARERAATDKAGAMGRIASPSEQKPLATMKKQAAEPARDEPAPTDVKGDLAAAQPAAAPPPPPNPGAAASSTGADGLAAQKESRRTDTTAAENERSQAGASTHAVVGGAAPAPTTTTAPAAAKPAAPPLSKVAASRAKSEAAPPAAASPPPSGDRRGASDTEADKPAPSAAPEPVAEEKAGKADDQVAKDEAKAKAKTPPPEQEFRRAQQEATSGRCSSALTIVQTIQRANPEFYKRRIAGDPTLESCNSQRKNKSAAPAKSAPTNLEDSAPTNVDRKQAK